MTLKGAVYFNSSIGNGKSSPLGRRFLPQCHLKELLQAFLWFLLDLNSPQTPRATAGLIFFCQKITHLPEIARKSRVGPAESVFLLLSTVRI